MNSNKRKRVFIQAAEQISIQQPLSEQWMEDPIFYKENFVKAINPSFRDYLSANEARRMGGLIKRALVTMLKILKDTQTEHPDAIITGTSIGSLDSTERFLDAMTENGEEMLSPTHFMQSTHNTVGSTLGIYTKTHSYNTTYSHGSLSFDFAVLDAWMQMQLGKLSSALVGGHDEMVDSYFELLKRIEYVGIPGMVPCSEVAMSMLLTTDNQCNNLCELANIRICHSTSIPLLRDTIEKMLAESDMSISDISAIMTGKNSNPANDSIYQEIIDAIFSQSPILWYKHLFGENYTVSGLGLYVAAHCLHRNHIPPFLYDHPQNKSCSSSTSILFINQMNGKEYSLILLKKI